MNLDIVRRIRGNVHGTIDVTALEDRIIAHPAVQRLRRIKQLAFLSYVFPGATHTRFEHSLGVMQLAGNTWNKMASNQRRLAHTCGRYKDFAESEKRGVGGLVHGLLAPTFDVIGDVFSSEYTLQALRLAGLLHDLGHPPFSHSGERFLPSWDTLRRSVRDASDYLLEYLERRCDALSERGRDPAKVTVRHEVYTLLLVDRMMREVYATGGEGDLPIDPRDVISIMAPEISPANGSCLAKYGVFKLCKELISGEVDIDRMDYLLRDSRECGVVYGIFDATRIQDSLNVYHDPLDSCLHLAITFSGLAAFEDYLRARYSMYLQLYFHKTSVAAEAMMQHLAGKLGGFTLPTDPQEYVDCDEMNIGARLLEAAGSSLESEDERRDFSKALDGLMRSRRLWKRVYEASYHQRQPPHETLDEARRIVAATGHQYEQVSSSNSLTTFRPRQEHEVSRNYLRLIKKDEWQFPRLVPIEDHSTLIASGDSVNITRIYVEDGEDENGENIPKKVKRLLTEQLRG